ncbi:MAG: hypothetical protein LBJ60_04155 [Tannerellaceae bacterium]|jgi:hypothetical protein|nr:hypothetical protein [Tannerellaceae bacterium]
MKIQTDRYENSGAVCFCEKRSLLRRHIRPYRGGAWEVETGCPDGAERRLREGIVAGAPLCSKSAPAAELVPRGAPLRSGG